MQNANGEACLKGGFPICITSLVWYGAGFAESRSRINRPGFIAFMETVQTSDFDQMGILAKKAQEGDGAAYETLLEQLYSYVYSVLRARLGYVAELDDLTQVCILSMHRALPSYHPSRNIRPWLQAIIRYKIADYFRAQSKRREFAQPEAILELANQTSAAEDGDPAWADQLNIHELLKQLPESWAKAVQLTKFDGMSCEDAARQEGVSAASLRKRVSRAYRKLAGLIEKERESQHYVG